METIWYCCRCSYGGFGGMSSKLYLKCLYCDKSRCADCVCESVRGKDAGESDPLYSCSQGNGIFTEREALRGDHHEFGALREISQPFTERASLLQTKSSSMDQTPFSYSAATKEPPTDIPEPASFHYSYNETEPISGVEPEIRRPGPVYDDRECTPRSCPDTTDPPDSHSAIDKDTHSAGLLFGEGCLPGGYLAHQSDMPADFYLPQPGIDELLRNTEGAEPNGLSTFDNNLEIAYEGADDIQPQRHQWSALNYPIIDVNALDFSHIPGSSHHSTSWTNNALANLNAPYQSSTVGSSTDQSKTSSLPAPFPPTPSLHGDTDRQQIPKKGKTAQVTRACESCSSTAELDGKPLACVFYKYNPSEYFKCNSKVFKTIGHLRQHLDKYHKLKEHHCKRCWASFDDEGSLKAHTGCQRMGGIPVDDLAPISKARDTNHNVKWFWIWNKLFGENTPLPQCPYSHPKQDLECYTLHNFYRDLERKGSVLTLAQIGEVISTTTSRADNGAEPIDY